MRLHSIMLLVLFSMPVLALENLELKKIQERIQPEGQVHIDKSNSYSPPAEKQSVHTQKKPGQEIYEQHCIVCHSNGLAGAPKLEVEKDWNPRITGRTIDDLLASSIKGINAMPAKGTCTECNDSDLKNAILFMLPKS